MADTEGEQMTASSRPGWRDVKDEVRASEQRIINHIDDVVKPLQQSSGDHESRLRDIEQGQTPWQLAMSASSTRHGERIGENESIVKSFKDRESGVFGTLKSGERLALMVISLGSFVVALMAIVQNHPAS